jgi:ATP-dependent DNA helicase Rep
VIKLEQNYRSKGRILQCANILIANNPHVFDKQLFSEMEYGRPVRVLFAKNEEHEAERVVAEIMGHKFMNGTRSATTPSSTGATTSPGCWRRR